MGFSIESVNVGATRTPLESAISAIGAGIITKATQIAVSSLFRFPAGWISLMGRVTQIPGGQLFLSYGPGIFIALATGVFLRYYQLNNRIDAQIQSDASKPGPSSIFRYNRQDMTAYICSNHPKNNPEANTIFCDAFDYAAFNANPEMIADRVQVMAIARGDGLGLPTQRAARAMVNGYMESIPICLSPKYGGVCALSPACKAQESLKKNHQNDPSSPQHYGKTAFLGGVIFTLPNCERIFQGINFGDSKLYLLRAGVFSEVSTKNPGESIGPDPIKNWRENRFSIEVQRNDLLFFMTAGIHTHLDPDPKEDEPGNADERKLATLNSFPKDQQLGETIMNYGLNRNVTHDRKTLLVITVKEYEEYYRLRIEQEAKEKE